MATKMGGNYDYMVKRDTKTKSLNLFYPDNPIRFWLNLCVRSNLFDYCILLFIIAQTILLAIESPLDDPSAVKQTLID